MIPALQVKNQTVFDLLDQVFYDRDFILFPKLTTHLGQELSLSSEQCREIGLLSSLLYLSSRVHLGQEEKTEGAEGFRGAVQMPVLLGDLLYGRFVELITKTKKLAYLPVYIAYLRQFNEQRVDMLQQQRPDDGDPAQWSAVLLARKTADILASMAGKDAAAAVGLEEQAERFILQQWQMLEGNVVDSLAKLESRIQAEGI